jgi:Flp pilus assembly protein TadB
VEIQYTPNVTYARSSQQHKAQQHWQPSKTTVIQMVSVMMTVVVVVMVAVMVMVAVAVIVAAVLLFFPLSTFSAPLL